LGRHPGDFHGEWEVKGDYYRERLGDLEEAYRDLVEEAGLLRARVWLCSEIIKLCIGIIRVNIVWRFIMFKNSIKIAFRNIKWHKTFSIINITGLVIGITCFILIMLYVEYEMSYDAFHEHSDRIFRVAHQNPGEMYMEKDAGATSVAALAPTLMEEFPEVQFATRFKPIDRLLLSWEEESFYETGLFADEHFFDVFSFQLIRGDKKGILEKPESIVISSRLAEKFFGNEDPIGRMLHCSLGRLEIAGIVENVPENSHIQFDWLIPFISQYSAEERASQFQWWGNHNHYTYCFLQEESAKIDLENKLAVYMNKKFKDFGWDDMSMQTYFLQPLESIHLRSHLNGEFSVNNSIKLIRLFSSIAAFILLIACINTMNLSSARAAKRMKEIGIRKVVGGRRHQLFLQFIGESIFLSALSLIAATGLVYVLLPGFNHFVERNILFNSVIEWPFILGLLVVMFVSGILSGIYPAGLLSSLKPMSALKGKTDLTTKGGSLRNMLVVFQFGMTIILMVASFVIFLQIRYVKEKSLGYNREHVVVIRMTDPSVRKNYSSFRNLIMQNPNVQGITSSNSLPSHIISSTSGKSETEDGDIEGLSSLSWTGADFEFFDVFQMEIVKGRSFSREFGTDENDAVIVNETFVRKANWTNPIGKKFQFWGNRERVVVGVVKDFHFQSLHQDMKPLFILCQPDNYYFYARVRSENIPATLKYFRETYERFKIRYPFEYFFLDDNFNRMYASEQKLGQMLISFSGLAIFIACLGIFGLASYTAERRTKEIGIRKVLGASVTRIMFLLSTGLTKWIIIANLVSWPIAYYAMSRWLQNFAYRIDINIWIFILSGTIALFIAILTVSYQTIKAATANPVDSLRYE
jgi:putative ABC transport system permease protein